MTKITETKFTVQQDQNGIVSLMHNGYGLACPHFSTVRSIAMNIVEKAPKLQLNGGGQNGGQRTVGQQIQNEPNVCSSTCALFLIRIVKEKFNVTQNCCGTEHKALEESFPEPAAEATDESPAEKKPVISIVK